MKVYNYKNGDIAVFENDKKVIMNNYHYFVDGDETNNLFKLVSLEVESNLKEMVSPSLASILSFADNHDCKVNDIETEVSGIHFIIKTYYIDQELKEVEIYRNGSKMISYLNNDINKGAIESVKKQLNLNF